MYILSIATFRDSLYVVQLFFFFYHLFHTYLLILFSLYYTREKLVFRAQTVTDYLFYFLESLTQSIEDTKSTIEKQNRLQIFVFLTFNINSFNTNFFLLRIVIIIYSYTNIIIIIHQYCIRYSSTLYAYSYILMLVIYSSRCIWCTLFFFLCYYFQNVLVSLSYGLSHSVDLSSTGVPYTM